MRKSIIFMLLAFMSGIEALAGPGTIVLKGTGGQACVYNNLRGRDRACYRAKEEGKVQKIVVPEKECSDLLYLIAGGMTSWIRVSPDETVVVNTDKLPWKFSGDEKQVNRYLYDWTQRFWFDRPNMLTGNLQMMFSEVPPARKLWPQPAEMYTPEYLAWINSWEKNALAALATANLKDRNFIAEQKERIHYNWLEMQFSNFELSQSKVDIPASAMAFVRDIRFDQAGLMRYPGWNIILRGYFGMADRIQLFSYSATDFLRKRAERIALPELRERYVLQELEEYFEQGWFYQGEEILGSVKELLLSEEGRNKWEKCQARCQAWRVSPENPEGKDLVYFDFEDYQGRSVTPLQFKGKYLLIDIWATWCGPCQYEIPYLKQLMEELKGKDIAFLSVSVDKQADKEKWKKMLSAFGLEDHGVIAPAAFEHNLFKKYKVNSIPRFMLVDPKGKMVMMKARRPSDILLKMQLEELLKDYAGQKISVSGQVGGIAEGWVTLVKKGSMSKQIAQVPISNGSFSLTAAIDQPGFYAFNCGRKFNCSLWLEPGDGIVINPDAETVFSGNHAKLHNLMLSLNKKYGMIYSGKETKAYDRTRGKRLRKMYDQAAAEIAESALTPTEKRLLTGYWQGYLLEQLYGRIYFSKVFGKSRLPRPEVKKGYSADVMGLRLLPELVHYSQWTDYLQEYLYARMEAGKIKIHIIDSWLAVLGGSIEDETLREAYLINTLQSDILRRLLHGIEARIESVRPWIKQTENQELLEAMPAQIAKARERFQHALPGTDLSNYHFENEKGEQVALGDFKGKYVFIDLWSTGCNPCIGEIPYIRDKEHRFAGQPIAWVSISLDLNKTIWKDFLKQKGMQGVQLICDKGFKHPFIRQIGLSGIPHFLLLDKSGKVVDPQTLRPSNPVLGEVLKYILAGK